MFKKRSLSKKRRQRSISSDEEEDATKFSKLAEIRADQRDRRRGAGITAADLAKGGHESISNAGKDADTNEEDAKLRVKNFKATDRIGGGEQIAHEELMHKYIDERLGLRKQSSDLSEGKGESSAVSEKDKLYEIPGYLKAPSSVPEVGGTEEDGMGAQGSAIAWNSGIAEVELPAVERLRNIQETEIALRHLEEKERKSGKDDGGKIIFQESNRIGGPRPGQGFVRNGGGGSSQPHRKRQEASDARIMQNFKKRLRR